MPVPLMPTVLLFRRSDLIDPEGYITVQGREKDQINRGGEKIAAEEIENLLLRHPAVIYAALVSMEDELMGEKAVLIWW